MSGPELIAATITLAALAAWVNQRFLGAPPTVALMSMALAVSLALLALDRWTSFEVTHLMGLLRGIDFRAVIMDGMLPYLLFAGALHVDLKRLSEQRVPVAVLATVGVFLGALLTGALLWAAAGALGVALTFAQALLFGALIAPTDPIAVLGILRRANARKDLEALISGESLLNDGVGVVLFIALLGIAVEGRDVSIAQLGLALLLEGCGGLLFGAAIGWLACHLLATVDDYPVEIFLTVGVAAGTYGMGNALHLSGPLAVVAAGLMITSFGRSFGMSERTQRQLDPFWEVVDEIMNAILFMFVGLEVLVVAFHFANVWLALAAVVAVLAGRWASVGALLQGLGGNRRFGRGSVQVLTWAGVRGGLSIALALSLPPGELRATLLTATYAVVLFTLLVQGATLRRVVHASGAGSA